MLTNDNEGFFHKGRIITEDIQFVEKDNSWIAIAKAMDISTGLSRYGIFEQPKRRSGREDSFAFTKAVHKARRTAIKQLLWKFGEFTLCHPINLN